MIYAEQSAHVRYSVTSDEVLEAMALASRHLEDTL